MPSEPNSITNNVPPRLAALLPLLADGRNNREIALSLGHELHTVENYVHDLKVALACRDRVEVVLKARREID